MSGPSRIKQRAREQGEGKGGGCRAAPAMAARRRGSWVQTYSRTGGGGGGRTEGEASAGLTCLPCWPGRCWCRRLRSTTPAAARHGRRHGGALVRLAEQALSRSTPSSSGDMRCAQQQITRCHSQSPQVPPARPTGLQCRPPGSAGMRGPPPASSPAVHAPVGKGEENEEHEWGCASHWGACEQTGAGVEGTVTPTLQQLASAQRCASPQLPGTNTSAPSASIDWDRMQPKAHLPLLLHLPSPLCQAQDAGPTRTKPMLLSMLSPTFCCFSTSFLALSSKASRTNSGPNQCCCHPPSSASPPPFWPCQAPCPPAQPPPCHGWAHPRLQGWSAGCTRCLSTGALQARLCSRHRYPTTALAGLPWRSTHGLDG